ncbi:MAG: DUF861 domain-containing protein [Anaerolineales bacterium]|nr:DUF861 domain-containing protein [Anaerolineales bacterium]
MKITGQQGLLIQTGSTTRTDFTSTPLEPAWILRGNPVSRSIPLAKAKDNNFSCGLWECTAGKFKFIYYEDEIVQILEGEVIIQEEGAEYTLKAGDTAYFPEGLTAIWTVPKYVKKFAVFHSSPPPFHVRVISKLKKFLGLRPPENIKVIG